MKNGEQPAFPIQNTLSNGITKREYFAAMAMQGLCSAIKGGAFDLNERYYKTISKNSLLMADELIKQLEL